MEKTGVLLINLGTPDDPTPSKVRPYLREFLMDPLVVDIPVVWRWLLVHGIILITRPKKSSEAYKQIWHSEKGSPLLWNTLELAVKVQKELGEKYIVAAAMRYGKPKIKIALEKLKQEGVSRYILFPLFPQYSLAASESALDACRWACRDLGIDEKRVSLGGAFFDDKEFVEAFEDVSQKTFSIKDVDHVLFSFHGVPERHVKKTDLSQKHCLATPDCCAKIVEANKNCYRAQCFASAHAIAKKLGLNKDQYTVSFQSRLGRTPWIKPYTDLLFKEFPAQGYKKIAVFCPSFVADCLETLEEIDIRGRRDFLAAGGEKFIFVPSLNSSESWVEGLSNLIRAKEPHGKT